jgi:hypothetical protein
LKLLKVYVINIKRLVYIEPFLKVRRRALILDPVEVVVIPRWKKNQLKAIAKPKKFYFFAGYLNFGECKIYF